MAGGESRGARRIARSAGGGALANRLPRWRGFNLLEMYTWQPGQEQVVVGAERDFRERDLEWIRDWGFDFVRIPMDYRHWTAADEATGSWRWHEPALERI